MSTTDTFDSLFNVRLQEQGAPKRRVIFRTTPQVVETTTTNYKSLDPVHMPGGFQIYNNTQSRAFSVSSITLVSRTREEASANMQRLQLLRSWQRPRFGEQNIGSKERQFRNKVQPTRTQSNNNNQDNAGILSYDSLDVLFQNEGGNTGLEHLGSPPAVLLLSAYSKEGTKGNIHKIPCVITQMSIPYPSDVDYIPTLEGVPFPIIISIDMSLVETHSPNEYSNFSLDDFRNGNLDGF